MTASSNSSSSPFTVANSVALVTGTNKSNGIGAHIVRALVKNGAKKVYATARNVSQVDYLVKELGSDKVVAVALDLTDLNAIQDLAHSKAPDVTLIVNNAAYFGGTSSLQSIHAARAELEVNYIAPLAIVQAFAPRWLERDRETNKSTTAIVTINSFAGLNNFPSGGTYSASKAAVHSLTQAQRRDLVDTLVMGVYPGLIDTDMSKDITSMPKTSPGDMAAAVVKALEDGTEDLFPDAMSSKMYEDWKLDAKAQEKEFASWKNLV